MNMIDRIEKHETKLDEIIAVLNELENALNNFEKEQNTIKEVNQYYGSKEWFEDKEAFENGEILRIKAGVLSEDAVWNVNERIRELAERMSEVSDIILHKKNEEVERKNNYE